MPRILFVVCCILLTSLVVVPVFAQSDIYLPIASSSGSTKVEPATITTTSTPLTASTSTATPSTTPTETATSTATATATPTNTRTNTVTPTPTKTSTLTPTATATPCANLGGVLSVDTTLVRGCNYNVTNNVLVSEGIMLSIPSSVTLRFNPDIYVIVDGALKVTGAEDGPSVFTRNSSGRWGGIKITEKSGSSSALDHVVIEYVHAIPSVQLYSALTVLKAGPALSNVILRYNASPFHFLQGARPISLIGGQVLSNTLGSYLVGGTIDGITFSGNDYNAGAIILACPGSSIQNSSFINNSMLPIYMGGCGGTSRIHIKNNTFSGNAGVIHMTEKFPTTFEFNTIYNNGQVRDNGVPTNAAINVECGTTLTANNIYSNTASYTIRARPGNCTINAANNWWGTTVASEIDNLIYDYDDDFTLGKIIYEPFSPILNP